MQSLTIYLAGPLFTLAERNFNAELAAAISKSCETAEVILPQDYARAVSGQQRFVELVFQNCLESIIISDVIVAILDGADADSGTCVEIGYAAAKGKPIIGVRTDLRAHEDRGLNLMASNMCNILLSLLGSDMSVEVIATEVVRAIESAVRKHNG